MGRHKRTPKLKWTPKSQTAIRVDKHLWDELQWLAERLNVSHSEATRRAIKMLAAVERKRMDSGQVPLGRGRPVTKAYAFLFGE